jgi:hypothetical protein
MGEIGQCLDHTRKCNKDRYLLKDKIERQNFSVTQSKYNPFLGESQKSFQGGGEARSDFSADMRKQNIPFGLRKQSESPDMHDTQSFISRDEFLKESAAANEKFQQNKTYGRSSKIHFSRDTRTVSYNSRANSPDFERTES